MTATHTFETYLSKLEASGWLTSLEAEQAELLRRELGRSFHADQPWSPLLESLGDGAASGDGAYTELLQRLSGLAGARFAPTAVREHHEVDPDHPWEHEVSLSFDLGDQRYGARLEPEYGVIDVALFELINGALAGQGDDARFVWGVEPDSGWMYAAFAGEKAIRSARRRKLTPRWLNLPARVDAGRYHLGPAHGEQAVAAGPVAAAERDPDISRLAVAGERVAVAACDGRVALFGLAGQPLGALVGPPLPTALALSPDGRLLAIGAEAPARVELWDPMTGRQTGRLALRGEEVWHVCFSADGARLAVAEGCACQASLFAVASGRLLERQPATVAHAVCFGPDGRLFVGTAEGLLWFGEEGEGVVDGNLEVEHLWALGPDRLAGRVPKGVRLWDRATLEPLGLLREPDRHARHAFSPDGQLLATVSGHQVGLRRVAGGRRQGSWQLDRCWARQVAWTPDGAHLLLAGDGGRVECREPESGERVWRARGPGAPAAR